MFVRKITDDAPDRRWDFLDQSGNGDDLLVLRQAWLLKDIDHRKLVAIFEVFFTNCTQIFDRFAGGGRRTGDEQT